MKAVAICISRPALVLIIASLACMTVLRAIAAEPVAPEPGSKAAASLDCPDGDLVYRSFVSSAPALSRGPDSVGQALSEYLQENNPGLDAARFNKAAEDTDAAQLTVVVSNDRVATAYVIRLDHGWQVLTFSACNSYLLQQKTKD